MREESLSRLLEENRQGKSARGRQANVENHHTFETHLQRDHETQGPNQNHRIPLETPMFGLSFFVVYFQVWWLGHLISTVYSFSFCWRKKVAPTGLPPLHCLWPSWSHALCNERLLCSLDSLRHLKRRERLLSGVEACT